MFRVGFIGFSCRRNSIIGYYKRTVRAIICEEVGKCPRCGLFRVMPMSYRQYRKMKKLPIIARNRASFKKYEDVRDAASRLAYDGGCNYVTIVDGGMLQWKLSAELACLATSVPNGHGAEYIDIGGTIARRLKVLGAKHVLILGSDDVMQDDSLRCQLLDEHDIEAFDMSGEEYVEERRKLRRIISKGLYRDEDGDVCAYDDDGVKSFVMMLSEQAPPDDPEKTIDAIVCMDVPLGEYLEQFALKVPKLFVVNAHGEHAKRLAQLLLTGKD